MFRVTVLNQLPGSSCRKSIVLRRKSTKTRDRTGVPDGGGRRCISPNKVKSVSEFKPRVEVTYGRVYKVLFMALVPDTCETVSSITTRLR